MRLITTLLCLPLIWSCNKNNSSAGGSKSWLTKNPKIPQAEKYAMDSKPYLINGARVMTANGDIYPSANVLISKGLIQKISTKAIKAPKGTEVLDAKGLTMTPGLIDVHSHMGVYPSPGIDAHQDGNEMSRPVTADVWAEHGFWPQDPDLWRALGGGITTIQSLPGSANLVGGRSFTAKLIPKMSAREMRFPGAPQGLKMACGENPKRAHRTRGITTRMGNVAGYRKAFQEALEYRREWENYHNGTETKPPKRNLVHETLVKVLKGNILLHFHCYRADDISAILDVADEFGFKIRTIHHGLEAYKIAPRLAKENVSVATWADWWGFKAEAYDGTPYNIALLEKAGAKAIVHSDSPVDVRFLNVETGKALSSARQLGLDISEDQALAWITKNPAWAIGLDDRIGTIEEGKMADLVLWDGHPFSIRTKTQHVFINGKPVFNRKEKTRFRSDFEVGYNDTAFYDGRTFTLPTPLQEIPWGDTKTLSKPSGPTPFLIENALAFIGGQWQESTSLLIDKGQIVAINPTSPAESIQRFDAQGRMLTAGLIDSSSSLGLIDIELDSEAQDAKTGTIEPSPNYLTADSLNLSNVRLPIHRSQGITSTLSHFSGGVLGRGWHPQGSFAAGYAVAFDLAPSSGVLDAKVAMYGDVTRGSIPFNRAATWSQLRNFLDESIRYQKDKASFTAGKTHNFETPFRHLKAMGPILSGAKPWIIKAQRADDIRRLIELKNKMHKAGHPIRLVIEGAAESWLVADELAKAQIPVMVTPSQQTPSTFDQTRARFDLAAFLDEKDVPLIITDSNGVGAARLRQEAGFAVKYGLAKDKALTAITTTPAKVFNLGRGDITVGATANLVLWSNDPLEPTTWVSQLWIGGKSQSLNTRQRQLADKYLETMSN